jgi:3-oxoacyl-[acyl-carrier protein] reductase
MSKLDGKIVLIAGGAGNVGEGIVKVFLEKGARVVVPSRQSESLDRLRDYLGAQATDRFIPLVGNIATLEGAEQIHMDVLAKLGGLDAVVVSLGGWWTGNVPLTQVSMEVWQKYLESNLTSHFIAARTFLPALADRDNASYTLLGGSAAEMPFTNVSPVAITAAGQLMLAKVVIEEMKQQGSKVRINELIVQGMVKTRAMEQHSQPNWITPQAIGEYLAWLASDEAHMVRGSILHLNQPPL